VTRSSTNGSYAVSAITRPAGLKTSASEAEGGAAKRSEQREAGEAFSSKAAVQALADDRADIEPGLLSALVPIRNELIVGGSSSGECRRIQCEISSVTAQSECPFATRTWRLSQFLRLPWNDFSAGRHYPIDL
jgi:hypothetical protein